MPKWLHDKLSRGARKKGLKGESRKAYIYGALAKYKKAMSKQYG